MEDAEGSEDAGEMSAMEEDGDGEWGGVTGNNETAMVEDSRSGTKPKKRQPEKNYGQSRTRVTCSSQVPSSCRYASLFLPCNTL